VGAAQRAEAEEQDRAEAEERKRKQEELVKLKKGGRGDGVAKIILEVGVVGGGEGPMVRLSTAKTCVSYSCRRFFGALTDHADRSPTDARTHTRPCLPAPCSCLTTVRSSRSSR
jgi:hypothetical protein